MPEPEGDAVLPAFSGPGVRCPKCWCRAAETRHCTPQMTYPIADTTWYALRLRAKAPLPAEWLGRRCAHCGYRWDEAVAGQPPPDLPELDARTVAVPHTALDDLIAVAAYVSYGRRAVDHQPDGAPYPDAQARRALGALRDAGIALRPGDWAEDEETAATNRAVRRWAAESDGPDV